MAEIATAAYEAKKAELKNDGINARWFSPLQLHVLPKLGMLGVEDITQQDIAEALQPIWHQKIFLLEFDMLKILEDLILLARERKKNPIKGSYTNKLLEDKNLAKEKVLEEINELIDAVEKNSNRTHEAADVFYHLMIYLEANDIKIEQIMQELLSRKK